MFTKFFIYCFVPILSVTCNLGGPFLLFGPESLEKYKRSILGSLEQDDLTRLYKEQPAMVVFNNQDGAMLSSGAYPRLRQQLASQSQLMLSQEFLDVRPEYVNNETQTLTLQGPWSERDAQMTETFARLQDIYGTGNVLGILGYSMSGKKGDDDGGWQLRRRRRQAPDERDEKQRDEEKAARPLPQNALYNATGQPGLGALFYSSAVPELRWPDGQTTRFVTPVGEPTIKPTKLYTTLVVRFADGDNSNKITLEFSFKQSAGWWMAVGVEVKRGVETSGLLLHAPAAPDAPSAVLGKAYRCDLPLVYSNEDGATLTFRDVLMQPYMDSTERFADAFDCEGFMTVPIWSGIMVSFLLLIVLAVSITMIMDIKTMDRFENNRSKMLTITVAE